MQFVEILSDFWEIFDYFFKSTFILQCFLVFIIDVKTNVNEIMSPLFRKYYAEKLEFTS